MSGLGEFWAFLSIVTSKYSILWKKYTNLVLLELVDFWVLTAKIAFD